YNSSNFSLKIQHRLTAIFQRKINQAIHETNLSVQELTNLQNTKNSDIEIINCYYECLQSRENLELSLYLKDKLTLIYYGYQKLFELKKIDTISLLGHKRDLITMDKEVLDHFENYKKTLNQLRGRVGIKGSDEFFPETVNLSNVATAIDFSASDNAVEKQLMQKKQELDSLVWRKSKSQILPEINFYSSFGTYYSSILNYQYSFWDQMNLNNFFNVGVTMDFTLFNKERKNAIHLNKLKAELSRKKAFVQEEKMEEFWKEIKMEYENSINLFNTVMNIKHVSYREFYLNQIKYNHGKITITQFLESYGQLKKSYSEFLYYKYTLLKQRDILRTIFEYSL